MKHLRSFGFLLKEVTRLSTKNFERRAAEAGLGLTLEQCRLLFYLQRHEGVNQKRLAHLSDTDPMTVVRVLDRMEQDGWIERNPDPRDRRAWRLRLKPAAAPLLKRILTIADRARADAMSGLDPAELELLISLLERIRDNLAALVPSAVETDQTTGESARLRPDGTEPPANAAKRSGRLPGRKPLKAAR